MLDRYRSAGYSLGIGAALALCAGYYLSLLAISAMADLYLDAAGLVLTGADRMVVPTALSWALVLSASPRLVGAPPGIAFPFRRVRGGVLVVVLVGAGAAWVVISEAASWLIPVPDAFRSGMLEWLEESSGFAVFLMAIVIAPLAEELFFRGLILHGLLGRYGPRVALWGSSLLFAAFHLNPWQAAVAFPVGLALAWLTFRTNSLIPAIAAHASLNATGTILLPELLRALGHETPFDVSPPAWLLVLCAIALTFCLLAVVRLLDAREGSPQGRADGPAAAGFG